MLFGVSLPLVGNGDGFLPGHSGVLEAFKGRGGGESRKSGIQGGGSQSPQ